MKNIIKSIIIFLMGVFIFNINNIKAIDINIEESDFYFTFVSDVGRNFSDKAVKYYINGNPAYCIEPGTPLGSNDYYLSNLDNLPNAKKDRILKIMYYGYMYDGHEEDNYYYATQALIWEELLNDKSGVVFSTELFKQGRIINLFSYKEEIEFKIIQHMSGPYNSGQTYDVNMGTDLKFADKGNYLEYRMDYDKDVFKIDIINQSLVIRDFLKPGTYNINFFEDSYYLDDYEVYKNDTKQDLLVLGNIPVKDYKMTFNISGCDLYLTKQSSETDEALEGATYGLYDTNDILYKELTTDSNGEASIINSIPYKTFYIKEIEAPKGYKLDDTKYNVYFNAQNKTINLTVKDEPIPVEIIEDPIIELVSDDIEDELIIENVPNTNKYYSYTWLVILGVLIVKKKCY